MSGTSLLLCRKEELSNVVVEDFDLFKLLNVVGGGDVDEALPAIPFAELKELLPMTDDAVFSGS